MTDALLHQSAQFFLQQSSSKPAPDEVVNALLTAEKTAKKEKPPASFADLEGNWRLYFITGTKKAQKRAGVVLGAGQYLPKLITINLNYSLNPEVEATSDYTPAIMENTVTVGLMSLCVSGCAKFLPRRRLLAFDFTRLSVSLLGRKIFSTSIRGGKDTEGKFYGKSIARLPFFSYFTLTEELIAARGKGGGLALWVKN